MITSKTNEVVKYIKGLHLKKNRDLYGEYIVEGIKMVKEAISTNVEISKLIVCEELFRGAFELPENIVMEFVSSHVFEYISDTQTPQGVLAVVKKKVVVPFENMDASVIFALDTVQDPGNLGTIIRTLDCAGIRTLLLSQGCTDEYNPKVIRSTMGASFRVNIYSDLDLVSALKYLKEKGFHVIVTALDADSGLFEYHFPERSIIVIGNESNGVSAAVQEIADTKIKIPMVGKTESLNAGVAASLMAYEYFRKKGI